VWGRDAADALRPNGKALRLGDVTCVWGDSKL